MLRPILSLLLAAFLANVVPPAAESRAGDLRPTAGWTALEAGLELGSFSIPEGRIRVLRIDPLHFRLRLVNASAEDRVSRSVKEWAEKFGLVAAINASMFQEDNLTSVSLMRSAGHVNNKRLTRDKAVLVFDPADASLPPARLLDRECDDAGEILGRYRAAVQSIRMVSCNGRKNVWTQQSKKWSAAAVGMDDAGRILFIHSPALLTTHDLIEHLLRLPLQLASAMYVEGGPTAQLYIRAGGEAQEFTGKYSIGSDEEDNGIPWAVPNIIGIERIAQPR